VQFLNTLPGIVGEEAANAVTGAVSGPFPLVLGGTDSPESPTLAEGPWSESIGTAYYNDLGCIHFHMGRWNLACHYFSMAAKENDNLMRSRQKAFAPFLPPSQEPSRGKGLSTELWPIWAQGCSRKYELAYNMGVSFLHSGKPEMAFPHLWTAVQAYPRNAFLWLRLAESCIMKYKAVSFFTITIAPRCDCSVVAGIDLNYSISGQRTRFPLPRPQEEFGARFCRAWRPQEAASPDEAVPVWSRQRVSSNPRFNLLVFSLNYVYEDGRFSLSAHLVTILAGEPRFSFSERKFSSTLHDPSTPQGWDPLLVKSPFFTVKRE
jgi:hypothetical protein